MDNFLLKNNIFTFYIDLRYQNQLKMNTQHAIPKRETAISIFRVYLVFLTLFCLPQFLFAQSRRYLKSHEYMAQLEAADTAIITNRTNLENTVQGLYKTVQVPNNPVIPIIFHVFYSNETEQISEAQIHSQIEALNRDYGFGDNNFTHESLDQEGFAALSNPVGLQFCLPTFSGDSSAINYYPVTKADWAFDNTMKDPNQQGVAPWNPQQFLNIYVVDLTDSLAVSGYAQMPGAADSTDAIVVDYRYVGMEGTATAPFHLGRTLVHLVGNWLGLYSMWGTGICDANGDFVTDTPHHNAPNSGCPTYRHVSSCYQNKLVVEMTMNFMDNTNDECLSLFTTGQKYRLFTYLLTARGGLLKHNFTCAESNITNPSTERNVSKPLKTPTLLSGQISLYPNPGRDYVQLSFDLKKTGTVQILITNLTGQTVWERVTSATPSTLRINTTNWKSGFYMLSVRQNNQLIHSEKLAIQQ